MDKDKIKGTGHKIKGKIKTIVGKAIGSKKMESEGIAEKSRGAVQNLVGGIKDTVKEPN